MNENNKTAEDVENANKFESQHIFINVDSNDDVEKLKSKSDQDLNSKQRHKVERENPIFSSLNCDTTNCDSTRYDFLTLIREQMLLTYH